MERKDRHVCGVAPGASTSMVRAAARALRASAAPAAPPPSASDLSRLHAFVENSARMVVVTGAGCSTESNIPDYRSPHGAYSKGYKPMTHQMFMRSVFQRQRYWARSFAGWEGFAMQTEPNDGHRALAKLEATGRISHLLTQNVDRLHRKAGSKNVVELHGTTHEVICMECGSISCRHELQRTFLELNPFAAEILQQQEEAISHGKLRVRPDGDLDLSDELAARFQVPDCTQCNGGPLKPDVVFFGDNLPKDRTDKAQLAVEECDALLVVGSSMMVLSAYRLAKTAAERGIPIAILNHGETRADHLAQLKVEALAGETLHRLSILAADSPNLAAAV